MNIGQYKFDDPGFLWLLLFIPLLVAWYVYKRKNQVGEQVLPGLEAFQNIGFSWKQVLRHILFGFRMLAISLLVVALARPQTSHKNEKITTEGIDIVISLDISGSMLAMDLKPNRLDASKEIAKEFIDKRPNDRIGLVVYAGESFTQCPITTDHKVLKKLFDGIKSGMIEDGTAIGHGIATAVDRLKDSPGKSKIIILLTDGRNNSGQIDPLTAAEIAKNYNIHIYTIGVGTEGKALYPVGKDFTGKTVYDYVDIDMDEETLQKIAEISDTKYFRATNNESLRKIYDEIDQMEKTKIEVTSFNRMHDWYRPFAMIALVLLTVEFALYQLFIKNYLT